MTTKTDPPAEAAHPKDVVEALAMVMSELGGIEKLTPAERKRRGLGGGDSSGTVSYAYRGIDQIAAAVQPLFAKYGIVMVPDVRSVETTQVEVGMKPWLSTMVVCDWTISGPNGTSLSGATIGEGRDNSDKSANKAMTSAFKNMLLKTLCIGDPDDDGDSVRHETDAHHEPDPIVVLFDRVKDAKGTPYETVLGQAAAENNKKLTAKALAEDPHWAEIVKAILDDELIGATQQEGQPNG